MMMEKEQTVNAAQRNDKPKEPIKGKMIRWVITLIMCVSIFKLITGLQSEKKQAFIDQAHSQAATGYRADRDCYQKVKKYFDDCIKGNYSSNKSGKYKRKYTFDLKGFNACLSQKP